MDEIERRLARYEEGAGKALVAGVKGTYSRTEGGTMDTVSIERDGVRTVCDVCVKTLTRVYGQPWRHADGTGASWWRVVEAKAVEKARVGPLYSPSLADKD